MKPLEAYRIHPRAASTVAPHSTKWWLRRPRETQAERSERRKREFFASIYQSQAVDDLLDQRITQIEAMMRKEAARRSAR